MLQLTEHGVAEQVTWQVDVPLHDTLPLFPTVTVHEELSQLMLPLSPVVRLQVLEPLQSALQEPAQEPVQVLALRHASDWLPAAPASAAPLPPPHVHAPPA